MKKISTIKNRQYDHEKCDRFQTELVDIVVFPECDCLISSFLFTSCNNVISSLTSILYLDNKTTRSERQQKHTVFSAEDYI